MNSAWNHVAGCCAWQHVAIKRFACDRTLPVATSATQPVPERGQTNLRGAGDSSSQRDNFFHFRPFWRQPGPAGRDTRRNQLPRTGRRRTIGIMTVLLFGDRKACQSTVAMQIPLQLSAPPL